jgi:hypothetical protein
MVVFNFEALFIFKVLKMHRWAASNFHLTVHGRIWSIFSVQMHCGAWTFFS